MIKTIKTYENYGIWVNYSNLKLRILFRYPMMRSYMRFNFVGGLLVRWCLDVVALCSKPGRRVRLQDGFEFRNKPSVECVLEKNV